MKNEELQARVEALTAQNARLRAALEPFAEAAKRWKDSPGVLTHDNVELWQRHGRVDYLTCGDLRKAAATLAETPAGSLEAVRAEAGRERAVRELEALAKRAEKGGLGRVPVVWAGGVDQSLMAFSDYKLAFDIRERAEEIAKEGK